MKIEYITYWSTKPYVGDVDLKAKIPQNIKDELYQGEKFSDGIYIDACKEESIKFLDKLFKVHKNKYVSKQSCIEIDQSKIDDYSYYKIMPKNIEWNQHVYFEIKKPKCKSDVCSWGSEITSPFTIDANKFKNTGISQIGRVWCNDVELVLSSEVKELFESENITGLEYEPCLTEVKKGVIDKDSVIAYMARISNSTCEYADKINLKSYCKKHNIIVNYDVFGLRTHNESMLNYDFFKMDKLNVKNKVYHYYSPKWVISSRVLKIILKNKVSGLSAFTWVKGKKFKPVY